MNVSLKVKMRSLLHRTYNINVIKILATLNKTKLLTGERNTIEMKNKLNDFP